MKHLRTMLYAFTGMAVGSLTVLADQQVAIDLNKVNASISAALTSFSAQSEVIESYNYSLRPETNLEENKFFLDASLAVSKTPWAAARTTAEGVLKFSTNLDDPNERGFNLGVDGRISTDALAMMKYKVRKVSHCDAESFGSGLRKILWSRHCEYVTQFEGITDVDQMYDFLADKIADHRADVEIYKAAIVETLQIENLDQDVADLLSGERSKADKVLDFLDGITLDKVKGGFRISSAAYDECPILGINGIEMEVTPRLVVLKGDVKIKFGQMLYATARDVLIDVLKGLEQGEEFAIKLVQYDAKMFENMIEYEMDHAR